MFVMSVIQAIAESNTEDKCLFLFEEPESFLHENHQEYFYKMVLCKLAEKHQVIYTTHSDRMVDIFDTR
jgi:predicted ATP-dependent endonuclease of OLD family